MKIVASVFVSVLALSSHLTAQAIQDSQPQYSEPVWWFGGAGAANLNFYGGMTQVLTPGDTTPVAFHEGFGTGLYLAPLVEYRPNARWGGILQIGYDDRSGSFNDVVCPCGDTASLSAKIRYLSIEPSVRYSPFSNGFHIFAGPRIGLNLTKSFVYKEGNLPTVRTDFSDIRMAVFSGQIGAGYDIPLTGRGKQTQVQLSPFASFQPYIGEGPRSVESWRVSTLRLGVALKFGRGKLLPPAGSPPPEPQLAFSVHGPRAVLAKRRIRETFPLRNYVFFEKGSTAIPDRYVLLTREQAAKFKEEQLQEEQPDSSGRSLRQINVYYNILNTLGDRLRRNPGASVELIGASEYGTAHAKERAEAIRRYLVETFGIQESRISIEGRDKPRIPSEQPGGTKELELLKPEDRRVDIESNSPEMLSPLGAAMRNALKAVQIVALEEDPLDSPVVFEAKGAKRALTSWSLEITDARGTAQHFGPFTGERQTLPGNRLLGDRSQGDYKVVMVGETKDGRTVRRVDSVSLVRKIEPIKESVRFSILFDFDKSKTVASYESFLTDVVTPLIPENGTVVIHGYTDIVGDADYNDTLSQKRVQDTRQILERAIAKNGRHGISFETAAYGEDPEQAPFDNDLPEKRFYNRTVFIDIVPQ